MRTIKLSFWGYLLGLAILWWLADLWVVMPATFGNWRASFIYLTGILGIGVMSVALMLAMLVTPATTASLLTRRLPSMMLVSALIGALSNITGLYLSFYYNIASGPAMVLVATSVFLIVFLFEPKRGLVWKYWRKDAR